MSSKRWFSLIVVMVLMVGGMLIVRTKVSASARVTGANPAPSVDFDLQRTQDANAARWVAMGEAYAKEAPRAQRAQDADIARWVAMGDAYAKEVQSTQRGQDADVARWAAMGEAYAKESQPTQLVQDANTARSVAMGEYYMKLQASKR